MLIWLKNQGKVRYRTFQLRSPSGQASRPPTREQEEASLFLQSSFRSTADQRTASKLLAEDLDLPGPPPEEEEPPEAQKVRAELDAARTERARLLSAVASGDATDYVSYNSKLERILLNILLFF